MGLPAQVAAFTNAKSERKRVTALNGFNRLGGTQWLQ